MHYAKAIVGLAVPLITALLMGFASGNWDYEQIGMLTGSLVTGLLVYLVPNTPKADMPPAEKP